MRMCLVCKKLFEKIHKHHISYLYDCTIEVCERCHQLIHRSPCYNLLKNVDHRNGNPDFMGDIYKCMNCGEIWQAKHFKKPFCPAHCPKCKNMSVRWVQDGGVAEELENVIPDDPASVMPYFDSVKMRRGK